MTNDTLFKKIAAELIKLDGVKLPTSELDNLNINKQFKDNHLAVLKILTNSAISSDGPQRTYSQIRNHFKLR